MPEEIANRLCAVGEELMLGGIVTVSKVPAPSTPVEKPAVTPNLELAMAIENALATNPILVQLAKHKDGKRCGF